jgi:hypothetical protein
MPQFWLEDDAKLSEEDSERGIAELDKFALDTLQELVLREKFLGISQTSLQHLARVDVGCIFKRVTGWQYFVNEVTRFPGFATWPTYTTEQQKDDIRSALVEGWLSTKVDRRF